MRALVLSGGASKGAFTAGVVYELGLQNMCDFDLAVGTSTGALVAGPALLNDYDYLLNLCTTVDNKEILGESFFEKIIHGIVGSPMNASMGPLYRLLDDYYRGEEKLAQLVRTGKELIVTAVCIRTGKISYFSSKWVESGVITEETFLRAILASCCEPVFTEPVRIFEREINRYFEPFRDDLFYDGSIRKFIPFDKAIQLGADDILGVSTHALADTITPWGKHTLPKKVNLLKALGWSITTLLDENSRSDRLIGRLYSDLGTSVAKIRALATQYGLSSTQADALTALAAEIMPKGGKLKSFRVISPDRQLPTSLEFDTDLMVGYFSKGRRATEMYIANQAPQYADLANWDDWKNEEQFT